MNKTTEVRFITSIPPIETAIRIHGESGARLTLDIADSELPRFFPVTLLRGKTLEVVFRVVGNAGGKD